MQIPVVEKVKENISSTSHYQHFNTSDVLT